MKTKYLIPVLALVSSITSYAQQTTCYCEDQVAYNAFVDNEKHQFVTEGEDAEITVLLSKKMTEDIILTYQITSDEVNLDADIIVPETKTVVIPKEQITYTFNIPTVADSVSESNETFTIELLTAITSTTKKKLRNLKLIRTRTIVDAKSTEENVQFYVENGVIKASPTADFIEVKNFTGASVKNNNLPSGIYYITAKVKGETITQKYGVTN